MPSLDIATSAGYARAVDFIEFIIHILPTTFAEILQLQYADYHAQDSPTTASTSQHDLSHCCHALVHISNICNISLKQCITEDDLEIMQTYVCILMGLDVQWPFTYRAHYFY